MLLVSLAAAKDTESWSGKAMEKTSPSSLPTQVSEIEAELKIALEEACLEAGVAVSSTNFSPSGGLWLWDDTTDSASAGKLAGWFATARKRNIWPVSRQDKRKRSESFNSQDLAFSIPSSSDSNQCGSESGAGEDVDLSETSLKERLGKAVELDILSSFSWNSLVTVCRTEHMKSPAEEEGKGGAVEVTVNSGGVVYYLLFHGGVADNTEAAACIKFAPSRLATQSEQLGLELARHLGVSTPQARVVHRGSSEWPEIIMAVESTKEKATAEGNEMGENTCIELLEALNINRSLLLMGYIDGSPLLDCPEAFDRQLAAEKTAATLGRVLVLDLILRNEDRLELKKLGWKGNPGNLMATKKPILGKVLQKDRPSKPLLPRGRGKLASEGKQQQLGLRKQLRSQFDSTVGRGSAGPNPADRGHSEPSISSKNTDNAKRGKFFIVAIDSGVPRRPPSSKAEKDKAEYPQFVELLLNDEGEASQILEEISGNRLACLAPPDTTEVDSGAPTLGKALDQKRIVKAFQEGFRSGASDMQDLRTFLLKLFRKFNQLLKEFVTYMASVEDGRASKDDSPSNRDSGHSPVNSNSPMVSEVQGQLEDLALGSGNKSSGAYAAATGARKSLSGRTPRTPPIRHDSPNQSDSSVGRSSSRKSREKIGESWSGKMMENRSGTPHLSSRLTLKLKDVNKSAKVDSELSKELDLWDARIREEGRKICKEQDFTTGFLDHRSSHSLVDSYELKIRLDHLLERMALIVHGIQTERPSCILKFLFIGGALAARSFHTLQHIGITDILCLCPNELSMQDDYPDSFEFKSIQVRDVEDENISQYFQDACKFIDSVEEKGGVILVHCFEGKSRSAAVVLGYLMLRKGHTLFQAWGLLKAAHPRAQPNDGFMKTLVQVDKELHGKVSMDWQQKKPEIRMCPVCGRSAGISNTSLRQHLRRAHPDVTQVPMTTKKSPEAHQNENKTAPLENLLSAVGV